MLIKQKKGAHTIQEKGKLREPGPCYQCLHRRKLKGSEFPTCMVTVDAAMAPADQGQESAVPSHLERWFLAAPKAAHYRDVFACSKALVLLLLKVVAPEVPRSPVTIVKRGG